MLPIALNLAHRRVLIIGGGAVAARKAAACHEAHITVIAPDLVGEFPDVKHLARFYQSGDCTGFDLVFAATNNRQINAEIAAEARSNKIWCNIADDPDASDFHTQSVVRRGDIAIGVSTGQLSPVLARHLRENIEAVVGPEYQLLQTLASEIGISRAVRGDFWRAVLGSEVLSLLQVGKLDAARALFRSFPGAIERDGGAG